MYNAPLSIPQSTHVESPHCVLLPPLKLATPCAKARGVPRNICEQRKGDDLVEGQALRRALAPQQAVKP